MIRLHVPDPLAPEAEIVLDAGPAHYLLKVMRLKAGDELLLFNGRDGEWRAVLAEADRRRCRLRLLERTRPQASPPDLELAVALVKRARLETIVEKAAELGCRRVRLIITRRSNADHARTERLQAIATEASEQTGRLDVPEVIGPEKLDRFLDQWPDGRRLMFCDEAGDDPGAQWGGQTGRARPASSLLSPSGGEVGRGGPKTESAATASAFTAEIGARTPSPAPRDGDARSRARRYGSPQCGDPSVSSPEGRGEAWTIVIGPEGGFDPAERERLRALPFVTPVTLGPRILRADTAAIAALSLWQAALGDWR